MKRSKLKKAVTLAGGLPPTIHNRQATDLLRNAVVAPIDVKDPGELVRIGSVWQRAAPDGELRLMRSLRDDPLGRMHARKTIDEAQYQAGRLWQQYWETIEVCGSRAIDFTKEAVDGGGFYDPFDDSHSKAVKELGRAARAVGILGERLLKDVLANRLSFKQCGLARMIDEETASQRFKAALETVSIVYGFSMRSPQYPQDVVSGA